MTVGEHIRLNNYLQFDHVLRRIENLPGMDPALVYGSPAPGFLGELFENIGPWRAREQIAFEWPGAGGDAKATGTQERARFGSYDKKQIVGMPGFTIASPTHWVRPEDFTLGGMSASEAARRAARPRLEWNKTIAEKLIDTALQGAFSSATDDFLTGFAWSAKSWDGQTVTQATVTDTANEAATVVAYSGQDILWPKRDGTEFAAGHDHLLEAAGASWTEALANTARDLILEHPNNANVRAIVGKNNANNIRAVLKTEYGAIAERVPIVREGVPLIPGFASVEQVGRVGSVDYFYCPDVPDDIALYYAGNKKPFYYSVGQIGGDGSEIETGAWSEPGNNETRGLKYGYRNVFTCGVKDPTAVVLAEYTS